MDYDDLLGLWGTLLGEHPEQRAAQGRTFRHLLVDEMQDTNIVQVELVEAIARAGEGNLTAVGDDAQSIYRFRGAHYDNILRFPDRNPGARRLPPGDELSLDPRDRRVHQRLDRAERRPASPRPSSPPGPPGPRPVVVATADAYEEADLICQQVIDWRERGDLPLADGGPVPEPPRSILLQGELVQRGIPYTVRSGLRFFEQAHIKDVLAYLRVHGEPEGRAGLGPAVAAAAGDRPGEVGGDPGSTSRRRTTRSPRSRRPRR